jgi:predicted dehydrogenase
MVRARVGNIVTKKRVLIVGTGLQSRTWLNHLRSIDEVVVTGLADIQPGRAAETAREIGLAGVYTGTDLDQAMIASRPDFMLNLTTPVSHLDTTVKALESGVPVLCEKPMADTMENAHRMVEASERTGVLLMINQQRRFDEGLAATRRLIVDHVGPLGILDSDFYRGYVSGGFRDAMSSPLLLDMAIHTFDAARYLCDSDPKAVYCEHFNPLWSWYPGNASAVAIFEMTGGLRYTYRGSWCSQGRDTPWEAEWRAVGPHGTVTWDGESAPLAEVVAETGVFPQRKTELVGDPDPTAPKWIYGALHEFLRALDTGETPMSECHDNIKSLAMVFGALESAETGRRVSIEI